MIKKAIGLFLSFGMILSLCSCGGSSAKTDPGPAGNSTGSWMLLVENDDLVLYNPETDAEFVIDDSFYVDTGADDASTDAATLSNLVEFSEDGQYVSYFSKPDSCYQLNVYDWTALCDDPVHTTPLITAYNASPERYQMTSDSIGYLVGPEVHWYSFRLGRDWTLCDTFEHDASWFYIAEDGQSMLVVSYVDYGEDVRLFKLRNEEELIPDSLCDSGILESYTTDLSEIVLLDDSRTSIELFSAGSDTVTESTTLLTLSEAQSQGYGESTLGAVYADANTICLTNGLILHDGTFSSMQNQVALFSTDRLTTNRNANAHYGSFDKEIVSAGHLVWGGYYDSDETSNIFSDSMIPFSSSLGVNCYSLWATYDSLHSILYIVDGAPKKGYHMYAYTISNGSFIDETLVSVSSHSIVSVFDEASGTLFYYEKEVDDSNLYTLSCITSGNSANPQTLLNGAGSPVDQSIYNTVKGALQFEDATGRILCWAEQDEDTCSGILYQLDVSENATATQICDQASYLSWGSLGDHIYLIQNSSSDHVGTLCVYDGSSITECKAGVQAVITPNRHYSKTPGYLY